jgi:hypothetical protein
MALKTRYLQELSDLFVHDLKRSQYYRKLPEHERHDLDDQIAEEALQGHYPLVPGGNEEALERLSEAIKKELNIPLPSSVADILRQVDGFVENGVSLYGVDAEFRDDPFDSGPGLLAENLAKWSNFSEMIQKYLFFGDSDLWFFALELNTGRAVALQRSTLKPEHYFSTAEEMVDDMMHQALGYLGNKTDDAEDEAGNNSTGFHFSRS